MIARRTFLWGLAAVGVGTGIARAARSKSQRQQMLFGTQAGPDSKGIYYAEWNASTGEISSLKLAAEIESPTFIVKSTLRGRTIIYSTSEAQDGQVAAFRFDASTGMLKELNRQTAMGSGTTHVCVHPDGGSVYVANYGSGSVTSYHARPDGSLSEPVSHFQYEGHGPNEKRQKGPHAHCVTVSPDGNYLLVNDLGIDCIHIYRINPATAELTEHEPPVWNSKPGQGPRHSIFHPNGRWLFDGNELDQTVDTLDWNAKEGTLTVLSETRVLPSDIPKMGNRIGEIALSKNARFLYSSMQDVNWIYMLHVDPKTGATSVGQRVGNGGKLTRHITLDPTERWMIACNQMSNNICVLKRDPKTGELSEEPVHSYPLGHPMCTLFL